MQRTAYVHARGILAMTVSGIGTNFADPLGSAFALARMAARVQPVRGVDVVAGRRPEESRPADGGEAVDSLFATVDVVELSGLSDEQELSEEEQARVRELQARDQEVRRHEAAHQAAAGAYASGGASFTYEIGPDGRRYAVGGEVQIDTSPVQGNPQATIRKLQQVRAAALAPGDPSAQDQQVAARATARIQEAQAELGAERNEELDDADEKPVDAFETPRADAERGTTGSRRGSSAARAYGAGYAEPRFIDALA